MPYSQSPSLASSGSTTMSNANNSVRGMSASDFTRIKKLRAMYDYKARVDYNVDVTNPTPGPCIDVCRGFGIGKYRRSASDWIAFKSAQISDYVVMSDRDQPGMGKTLTVNKICQCPTSSEASNIMNKDHICIECKSLVGHARISNANAIQPVPTIANYSNSWPIPGNEEWRSFCSGYHAKE
jgi:hypothetical protein